MSKKQVAPATDWRTDLRAQLQALSLEALENFVAIQSQQAKVEGFMSNGFAMSVMATERHMEKMQIAHEVLAERYHVAAEMVEAAYWEQMDAIADAAEYQIAQCEAEQSEMPEYDGDGEEF